MRTLLIIIALLAGAATAETVPPSLSFGCVGVGDITFVSDNFDVHAAAKPPVLEFSKKEPDKLSMETTTGLIGPFTLSPVQAALPLDQLMKDCKRQAHTLARRNTVLTAAFANGGLHCFKDEDSLLISNDPTADGTSISAIRLFDKKVPDQLTALLYTGGGPTYFLSPEQAVLSLDQLLRGCELKADER